MKKEENKVGIHQPNFFPWLGYFYKIHRSDKFVFLDDVQIELASQQAYVNRTKINSPAGEAWITCPVSRKLSPTKIIKDIVFEPNNNWRKKIKKSLFFNYKKSAFFDETFPLAESLIENETENLADFNIGIIESVCKHIGITAEFFRASDLKTSSDERNQRLIEICTELGSSEYLSGKGGLKYHDPDLFQKSGIQIVDLGFQQKVYEQVHGDFQPGLSVLDVLFNCGKNGAFDLLKH
ncbi:MAG: WbqC family protein [Acidobacteria bacterium]|nr:WbqC family protein [Acidobacteriota bacterium]